MPGRTICMAFEPEPCCFRLTVLGLFQLDFAFTSLIWV